jgi:hypothetical protein
MVPAIVGMTRRKIKRRGQAWTVIQTSAAAPAGGAANIKAWA